MYSRVIQDIYVCKHIHIIYVCTYVYMNSGMHMTTRIFIDKCTGVDVIV